MLGPPLGRGRISQVTRWFPRRVSEFSFALRRLCRVAQAHVVNGGECPSEVLRAMSWGGGRDR